MLHKLDRILLSNNATVNELLEQAIVAGHIADDADENVIGPLTAMYHELQTMKLIVSNMNSTTGQRQYGYGLGESNPYQNITWSQHSTISDVPDWWSRASANKAGNK